MTFHPLRCNARLFYPGRTRTVLPREWSLVLSPVRFPSVTPRVPTATCLDFRSRYRANLRSPSLQPGGYLGSAVAANSPHKLGATEKVWSFTFR
jgi:hypothetical protein